MKKLYILFFSVTFWLPSVAQTTQDSIPTIIDSLYREDQFYFGATFHLITNMPEDLSQAGFSGGIHLGFIRDFPLNKRRNVAIGAGLGWSINTYGHEMFIGADDNGNTIFRNLDALEIEYDLNRFTNQLIEMPLEFRWRTSTPTTYKFWRVYTGLRLGYVYHFRSNFKQPEQQVIQTNIPELNRFRIGTTLTFGYNTFNLHVYYGLNGLFNGKLNDDDINYNVFKLGLMFYIL